MIDFWSWVWMSVATILVLGGVMACTVWFVRGFTQSDRTRDLIRH